MDIQEKIKRVIALLGREAILGGVVFLLVALAFGSGWLAGSRTFTRPPIIVNCPPTLYDDNR